MISGMNPRILYADSSGTCGDSLTWTFSDATKTLTISGSGAMYDYHYRTNEAPWTSISDKIEKLVIEEGVTKLGNTAFLLCGNMKTISFPESLTDLGEDTFQYCTSLKDIRIPSRVEQIRAGVFFACKSLKSVTIPASVTSIGDAAFFISDDLENVIFERPKNSYHELRINNNSFNKMAFRAPRVKLKYDTETDLIGLFNGNEELKADKDITTLTNVTLRWDFIPVVEERDIRLDKKELILDVGQTEKLTATLFPDNATFKTVYWFSDNEDIVTVNEDGLVTAVSAGTTTVEAESYFNKLHARCKVTVRKPEYNIEIVPADNGTIKAKTDEQETDKARYGAAVSLDVLPDKGYELDSLNVTTKEGSAIELNNNQFTMPADDVIINASFRKLIYGITYNLDGGSLPEGTHNPEEYATDSDDITLINPVKEHSTFLGWTGTDITNPSTAVTIRKGSTGNREYTANWEVDKHQITFYDEDGTTVLQSTKLPYGSMPSYTGSAPAKQATAQYTYEFAGWDPELAEVTADAQYKAEFKQTVNKYKVTFVDDNGNQLQSEDLDYGTTPSYKGETPVKAADKQYSYSFAGWDPQIDSVKGDVTYKTTFNQTLNKYTITWKNYDGTTLETDENVSYGSTPAYNGETPSRNDGGTAKVYEFAGWNPRVSDVVDNQTYTATFVEKDAEYKAVWIDDYLDSSNPAIILDLRDRNLTLQDINDSFPADPKVPANLNEDDAKEYTYSFLNWQQIIDLESKTITFKAVFSYKPRRYTITWIINGVSSQTQAAYGAKVTYTGETPAKASTGHSSFSFTGWDPDISHAFVNEDKTYTAQFIETKNRYKISFLDENDNVLETDEVEYGSMPEYKGEEPAKESSIEKVYTFAGWIKQGSSTVGLEPVTGDTSYKASFSESPRQYLISFRNDDGSLIREDKYDYGTAASDIDRPADPTKDPTAQYSYTFSGWNPAIANVEKDVTYTAEYSALTRQYKVSFDSAVFDPISDQTVEYGNKVIKPAEPSKDYYSFGGWYKDPQFKEEWNFETDTVKGNTRIYLKAVGLTYTVTLNPNGGTLPQGKEEIKISYGSAYGPLPTPVKEGVIFDGWYNDENFSRKIDPEDIYNIQDNSALFARYKYEVSFREIDGTAAAIYVYDDLNRVAYPGKAKNRNGYVFDCWVTSSSEQKFDFLNDETYPKMVLAGKYHKYVYEGIENTWVLGNSGNLGFRFVRYEHVFADKPYEGSLKALFIENGRQLFVDDVLLDQDQYIPSDGSLIITMHDSCLNKLSAGKHKLTVRFADGEVSTYFYVKERAKPITPAYIAPKTGIQH